MLCKNVLRSTRANSKFSFTFIQIKLDVNRIPLKRVLLSVGGVSAVRFNTSYIKTFNYHTCEKRNPFDCRELLKWLRLANYSLYLWLIGFRKLVRARSLDRIVQKKEILENDEEPGSGNIFGADSWTHLSLGWMGTLRQSAISEVLEPEIERIFAVKVSYKIFIRNLKKGLPFQAVPILVRSPDFFIYNTSNFYPSEFF